MLETKQLSLFAPLARPLHLSLVAASPRGREPTMRKLLLPFTLLAAITACQGSAADTPAPNPDTTQGSETSPQSDAGTTDSAKSDAADGVVVKPAPDPSFATFLAAYQPVQKKAKSMTLQEFLAEHTPKDAPKDAKPAYDPLKSKYLDLIDKALQLTPAEKAKLAANGFVASDRMQEKTFAEALLKVFQKDLPVLVTTDAILQALHASYDDILKTLEQHVLLPALTDLLGKTHLALAKLDPGADPLAKQAKDDADFFVTVARSLLLGQAQKTNAGGTLDKDVATFLGHVEGLQLEEVTIFGTPRTMDFSQFKPRGHYAGVPELEKYFRAMMWLGRVDFRFAEFDANGGGWSYWPRQVMGAVLLHQAVDVPAWQAADDLIGLMVGPVDYIDFQGVAKLVAAQGWKQASDVAKADAKKLLADLIGGKYGAQKIASHFIETNPFSDEPTPLPPSFTYLGQRFVVDSHVFANVVYDRVVKDGNKVMRAMPSPLDALFVMGNGQVLPLLADEFAKFPYWGQLHVLRYLVDSYDQAFWQGNLYNLWLDALRTLNAPTTGDAFPFAMKTPAWRDKTANTQLGSWAQLRHDTLLYAKQSYTGGVACEHPSAMVEPYPAFFGKLKIFGQLAGQYLGNFQAGSAGAAPGKDAPWVKQQLASFFANWADHMGKLQAIAQHELDGKDLTQDELKYLKGVISADPGCGAPVFSGWYASLYFSADNLDKWKPTIADVHTNPNQDGPLAPPRVLHVATGNVGLMVFTADRCSGAAAFVGPVFRYHEVEVKEIKRLNDQEWEKMLQDGSAPQPPKWTESYRVVGK
jgi:hypothetical protein